jgi:hypothetical protein
MADTQWHADWVDEGWMAARGLVCRLDEDNPLPVLGDPLAVDGEIVHADVHVDGWWYGEVDVLYEERQLLDFSGFGFLAMTAVASAVGNRRSREAAAALAAPRWRHLADGPVRAVLTADRLVLEAPDGTTLSIGHAEPAELIPDLVNRRLQLQVGNGHPLALTGEWVPYLTVGLIYARTGEVVLLDAGPAHSHASG